MTRRRLGAALLILFSAGLTYAVGEHFLLVRIPHLMLGSWVVVEGQYEGSTVEFLRDGTMISHLKQGNTTEKIEGQVRVDDNTLWVTTCNSPKGQEKTDILTVLDLSSQQLVTQNEDGVILIMKRTLDTSK